MTSTRSIRSTAEAQRERITDRAVSVFARTGYFATPVTDVAEAAGVSPAYIFRLFAGKLGLFVAAVERCYENVDAVLSQAGEQSPSADPGDRLDAMTSAYVDLIADRDLIRIQVHAQSACDVPEVRAAVQTGLARIVRTVSAVSGAEPAAVQRFLAYGQLCHLVVQAELDDIGSAWSDVITAGIRHP